MRATRNGWTIEGTPGEIHELIEMSASTDTLIAREPVEIPEKPVNAEAPEKTRPMPKRDIDWPKADSLRNAGWSFKAIAEELRTTYQTVYSHFNPVKRSEK